MRIEMAVTLTVALFLASLCVIEAQTNPPPYDAASDLARSIDDYKSDIDQLLVLMKRDGEVMTAINAAIDELQPQQAREAAIVRASSHMDQAYRIASEEPMAGDELRKQIALAIDRLRTARMDPLAADLPKLADELHHSVVEAALSSNLVDISRARAAVGESIGAGSSLGLMTSQLNSFGELFDSQRFASRLPRSGRGGRGIQPAMNRFHGDVQDFLAKARVEHQIQALATSASVDLDTFQNAIGLDKAIDRMKEADEKSTAVEIDPELRKAVLWTIERLKTASLSPSSTNMPGLREELHHRLLHRAALVEQANVVTSNALLQAALSASGRLNELARSLSAAVQTSSRSLVPAIRPDR
ncbi:MAG: hypothetical protein ABI718_13260 [Acidobacteriota bacterium]